MSIAQSLPNWALGMKGTSSYVRMNRSSGEHSVGEKVSMEFLNCVQTTARLHLYLDRELNTEEIAIVQSHLAHCPNCDCRFHFDLHLKRLLHERCTIEHAPVHLREAVLRLASGDHVSLDPALAKEIERELKADWGGC
jgi:mycothiol system anti-sigma-R factor